VGGFEANSAGINIPAEFSHYHKFSRFVVFKHQNSSSPEIQTAPLPNLLNRLVFSLMSALGHSRLMHPTPVPANVRFAPLATEMLQCGECSEVPIASFRTLEKQPAFSSGTA
jgi:hypothetical protein